MKKSVSQKKTKSTKASTTTGVPTPLAEQMRHLLGWVAHNVEDLTDEDIENYEANCLRSQVLQLMALANDVESLEVRAHHARETKAVAS